MLKMFRVKKLREALLRAETYGEWLDAAGELDRALGMDAWRKDDSSPYYNYRLVRRDMEQMREYRETANVYRLLDLLHDSLRRNLGDVGHPNLYDKALTGTKHLIEEYLAEAEKGLNYLCDNDFPHLLPDKKLRLFSQAAHNFGRSALMLSGGATFGIFHLGVVRTLWDHKLLPRVISGSSMGAIIAAGTCTRTDTEIQAIHDRTKPLNRNALRWLPPSAMWREKSLMDQKQLLKNIQTNVGEYTFAEAYARTGRILNISVSPTRMGIKPRVLNYITAPNVTIASAACASSAVPGVFPPAKLMAKDRAGQMVPYMANEKWVDGTLREDIPIMRLSRLHNVNHYIVSQANPHVIPFFGYRHRRGFTPFVVDLAASMVQGQVMQVLDVARQRVQQNPWRPILDQMYAVAGQQYSGDINIHLPFSAPMYRMVLANPTEEQFEFFVRLGERASWSQVERIRNQTRISRCFESCLEKLSPEGERVEERPL